MHERWHTISSWVLAVRPKTLPAAIVPVCLGSALAWSAGAFEWTPALLCLSFAVLIQIGTNFANDYFDFIKGTDTSERIGPMRVVAAGLIKPRVMWRATLIVLSIATLIGLSLIAFGGWWLLLLGALSVVCAVAYTGGPYPLAYLGLGDIFVFIFFGLVAVVFTFFIQTGSFSWASFWVGAGVGALTTNILVVNNYRDIKTDAPSGKKTLAVRFGRSFTLWQYSIDFCIGMAVCWILWFDGSSFVVLLPMILIPEHLRLAKKMAQARVKSEFDTVLSGTARLLIFYGIFLGLGILVNSFSSCPI